MLTARMLTLNFLNVVGSLQGVLYPPCKSLSLSYTHIHTPESQEEYVQTMKAVYFETENYVLNIVRKI
jgi:hypothetical protein